MELVFITFSKSSSVSKEEESSGGTLPRTTCLLRRTGEFSFDEFGSTPSKCFFFRSGIAGFSKKWYSHYQVTVYLNILQNILRRPRNRRGTKYWIIEWQTTTVLNRVNVTINCMFNTTLLQMVSYHHYSLHSLASFSLGDAYFNWHNRLFGFFVAVCLAAWLVTMYALLLVQCQAECRAFKVHSNIIPHLWMKSQALKVNNRYIILQWADVLSNRPLVMKL